MRNLLLLSLALALAACGKSDDKSGPVAKPTGDTPAAAGGGGGGELTGAGSTFVYPLVSKWTAEYAKANPGVSINYQSIGSGGGIKQFTEKTVDFGATDVAMTDEELGKVDGKVIQLPWTLGAAVLAYNLPGVKDPLKLTGEIIAGIYLGDIKTWNDPKIAAANPGVTLPGDAISVAYRSDGSGTTAVFTAYLSAVSDAWKTKVGSGKSVSFPVGSGAKGSEGVSGLIKTTPGTIGYVELAYAKQTGLQVPLLQNAAGKFVEATADTTSAAAAGFADKMPADFRLSIVNAPGDTAYPISTYSYVVLNQDTADAAKGQAVAKFVEWAIHDGQKFAGGLDYAPLPDAVVAKEDAALHTMTSKGQPLLK